MPHDQISIANSPAIPGLSFRSFRGEGDYPSMLNVLLSSAQADKIERNDTVDGLAKNYQRLTNCNPYQDMIFVEIADELVGYGRGWWWDEPMVGRIYGLVGFLVPERRRKGIGRTMLAWLEQRLLEIARGQATSQVRFYQANVAQFQAGTAALLEQSGYKPVRYFYEMVCPTLDTIPEWPLPEGIEVRPVLPEHYRAIWTSVDEASQDEWGYRGEDYETWLSNISPFQPHLWQIAWDVATCQVAGHVLTFIDEAQNEQLNRKRGYTEGIGVGRAWRRRGLARALISRSLQAQKASGMTESALAADSESANGATRLYESCGFKVVHRDTIYRKLF